MGRIAIFVVFVCPALALCLAAGCGKRETPAEKVHVDIKPPVEVARTPLEVTPDGVVRGKVLYDGEPPPPQFLNKINLHADKAHCLKGGPAEINQPTWMVNKDNHGVANVVVWIDPPAGRYFALTPEEKAPQQKVVLIDQPHCAFIPHVVAVFPAYWDGTAYQKTGQFLRIKNSAPFSHAAQWDNSRENDFFNQTIPPGEHVDCVNLNPQKKPLFMGCGVHNWMTAYIWVFDNPYHAVTREDGSFEIHKVPSGVEATFNAWHESRGRAFETKPMTFRKGDNPALELKIKQVK